MNELEKNNVFLSKIGLGIEHFARRSKVENLSRDENSAQILEVAYKFGITHFDLVFNLPYFFDVFREFIKDKRDKITFTTHLGSLFKEKGPSHSKTRSLKLIQDTYEGMLNQLNVDNVDIALLQFVTHFEDFQKLEKTGILKYAKELKKEGTAKTIGLSAHKPELILKILQQTKFEVVMFPLNFATGIRPETKELIKHCKKNEIAIIAIKNLLKAKVFSTVKQNYSAYYTSGSKFSLKLPESSNPKQCFQYALDQGADAVIFGVKNVEELRENMSLYNDPDVSSNYSKTLKYFQEIILTKASLH